MAEVPIDQTKDELAEKPNPTEGGAKTEDQDKPGQAEPKGDLNKALHEARDAEKAAKERAEKAEARAAELEQKQKENERGNLSDEEYADAVLRDAAIERVLDQVEAELGSLTERQRSAVEKNPWLYVEQRELDAATRGLSKREGWRAATKIAVDSIKDIVGDVKPAAKPEDEKKDETDPTLSPGAKSGDGEATQYTQGQLLAMAQTDPEKFERVRASLRGK